MTTRRTHWMVIILVLALALMSLAACGDTPAATSTPVPLTATAVAPTATTKPATATPVPPTATAVPPTATAVPPTATTAPTPDTALVPPPTGDAPINLSNATVENLTKSVPAGQVLKAQLVADDRDPSALLDAYVTQLQGLNWQSVRVGGKLDITKIDNAYFSYLTKDGTDLVLRAQDVASFSLPDSPLDQSDFASVSTLLQGRKTVLFIATGKGIAQAIVNNLTVVEPTPTANPTNLDSGAGVTLSPDSLKAVQSGLKLSGTLIATQVFSVDLDQQAIMEETLKAVTVRGWKVLPVGGNSYFVNDDGGVAVLTQNGSDLAIVTIPAAKIESNIDQFSSGDQAKVRQLANGKKTLYFAIVGTGFATDLQKQFDGMAGSVPTADAQSGSTLNFDNETPVALSAETAKSVQQDFNTKGQINMVQVFGDSNDQKLLIETTLTELTGQGWTIIPIAGQNYLAGNGSVVALLTHNGLDLALSLSPADNIGSTIAHFTTADQAKVHQLVDGKKSMALVISGKNFAQALATQFSTPTP